MRRIAPTDPRSDFGHGQIGRSQQPHRMVNPESGQVGARCYPHHLTERPCQAIGIDIRVAREVVSPQRLVERRMETRDRCADPGERTFARPGRGVS